MPDGAQPQIATLVAEHQAALYRYAFRLCGNAADAEDLTQQAFLLAHANLRQLSDADRAKPWLYAIVRNCYLKSFRRWLPLPETDLGASLDNLPEQADEASIDQERLQAALDDLPAEFKVVLLMFYFEQYSYREIADQLELPIGTVMSRLSRAKQHLRRRLFASEEPAAARQSMEGNHADR